LGRREGFLEGGDLLSAVAQGRRGREKANRSVKGTIISQRTRGKRGWDEPVCQKGKLFSSGRRGGKKELPFFEMYL